MRTKTKKPFTINPNFHRHHRSPIISKSPAASNQPFRINRNILLSPRYYRMFALATFAFLLSFVASAILTPVSPSSAQEITYQHNATGYYITVANSDNVSLSAEATNSGTLVSASDIINVKTNSPLGYQLYVSATNGTDGSNNLYKNGNPANASTGYFKPVSGTISAPATLTKNTWGFALAQDAENSYSANFSPAEDYSPTASPTEPTTASTWAAVPVADNAQIIKQTSSKTTTDGDSTNIYYGINATTQIISGEYSNTITYTAFSDVINDSQGTMQDFTTEQCNNIPEDSFIILTDTRDSKDYMVSHLKDGNCWMTQNLALAPADVETDLVLTPSDSNVTAPRTIPGNSLIDGNGTTTSTYDTPQIIATFQSTTDDYGSFYGNYYNWNAATATVGLKSTTGTVYESICPKGWRLPDNGNYNETDTTGGKIKSYSNLLGNYTVNVDGTGDQMPTTDTTNAKAVARIQQIPLYFPLAGRYYSSMGAQGVGGSYQTRTTYSPSKAHSYVLGFNTSESYFNPQSDNDKSVMRSVRCVFEGSIEDNMKMQDVTIDMCNNLDESTATTDNRKTLIDSRDNKAYRVSKLADGNCWMVQNLALDGTDSNGEIRELTPADSDVTENRKLAVNATSGTSNTEVKIYADKVTGATTSCNLTNYPYCIESNEPYGNLYNWFAATATTGTSTMTNEDAPDSICPKNWKLPTSGSDSAYGANAPDKSYGKLTYAVLGFNAIGGDSNGAYAQNAQKAPLYLSLAGGFDDSGYSNQGKYGLYWSRVAYTGKTSAYYLRLGASSGEFYPQRNDDKAIGRSVRCVLIGS